MTRIRDISLHAHAYVTVEELAEYLRLSERTVYYHIEKGALHTVKFGAVIRIPIAEARRYAAEGAFFQS